ncbi:MAG: hypothetical protein K6L73_01110 [Cellvibrionaceae bacterium]
MFCSAVLVVDQYRRSLLVSYFQVFTYGVIWAGYASFSQGMAWFPGYSIDLATLIALSDKVMYEAKASGKARFGGGGIR